MSNETTVRRPGRARLATLRGAAMSTAALGLVLGLTACGEFNFRRDLGLVSKGPDEFTVIKQKPLQIPDEMPAATAQLPEPRPGARSLVEPDPDADARAALLGPNAAAPTQAGPAGAGETALLSAAGAGSADPAIRAKLLEDAESDADKVRLLDEWLGRAKAGEEPLDPAEEARLLAERARLTKNPGLVVPPAPEPAKQ